jgi:hypothetical protein
MKKEQLRALIATKLHRSLALQMGISKFLTRVKCFRVKQITGIKKAMTKTMTESLSIPFFTFSDEIDAT